MKSGALAYLATLVAFLALDFVWLSNMSATLYRPALKDMLLDEFRVAPAVLFYAVYVAGLVFLAVRPALASASWRIAPVNGAVFGFCAYATYDLTNQATLRNWSTTLTLADIAWGAALSAVAATFGALVTSAIASAPAR